MNVGVIPATAPNFYLRQTRKNKMFKVYYTNPRDPHIALAQNVSELTNALECCEYLRNAGMSFVTMVSDYEQMTGPSGAKMSGSEYVPQMLNP